MAYLCWPSQGSCLRRCCRWVEPRPANPYNYPLTFPLVLISTEMSVFGSIPMARSHRLSQAQANPWAIGGALIGVFALVSLVVQLVGQAPSGTSLESTKVRARNLPASARQIMQYPDGVPTGLGGGNAGASVQR